MVLEAPGFVRDCYSHHMVHTHLLPANMSSSEKNARSEAPYPTRSRTPALRGSIAFLIVMTAATAAYTQKAKSSQARLVAYVGVRRRR